MPLGVVDLIETGLAVHPPPGMVYSTNPQLTEASDGYSYFVKGPELGVVVAELMGSLLAEEVGLQVPAVAAARRDGEVYSGSREVAGAIRHVMPWLKRPGLVTNADDLFSTIVVDSWLVNTDRNLGNCLAYSTGHDGRVILVMIDFEKSVALRGPYPLVECPAVDEKALWPSGDLGTLLRRRKEAFPPPETCQRIAAVTAERLSALFDELQEAVGVVPWRESSISVLLDRGRKIREITGRVWQQ